ncbi:MAG: oligosaccharide flippase family protein [Clostridia bacterium]|nr:oligosaccharide flippase family protein [Clostridia bacterium]
MYKRNALSLRLKRPVTASLSYMIAGAMTKLIGIISTPIFTRLLSGEEYGSYTLYMSYLGLATTVAAASISAQVLYRGFEKYKGEEEGFGYTALVVGESFSLLLSLIFIFTTSLTGLEADMIFALSLQLMTDTVLNLTFARYRYKYNYRRIIYINLFTSALSPLIAIALTVGAGVGYKGRVYALLGVSLIAVAPIAISTVRQGIEKFDRRKAIYIIKNSFPLIPNAAAAALNAEIDKLMISAHLGATALAKYSIAHTLGLGLGFLVTSLNSALYPWVIRKLSANKTEQLIPLIRLILSSLGALIMVLTSLVPEIFGLLAPTEYGSAKYASIPLALCAIPAFATSFITTCIVYAEKSPYTTLSAAASALTSLMSSAILIPRFNYIGAGISLLLSNVIALFVNYILLYRCKMARFISPKDVATSFVLSAIFSISCALCYPYLWARILLLIIPSVIILNSIFSLKDYVTE